MTDDPYNGRMFGNLIPCTHPRYIFQLLFDIIHMRNRSFRRKMAMDAYTSTDFGLSLEERVRAYMRSVTEDLAYQGFDTRPLQQAKFIGSDVSLRQTVVEFKVEQFLCNKDGNLHGGAVSTIFDNLSSTSLFTIGKPGFWDNLGTSRSINVIFHKALPRGSEVRVVCNVVAAGKRMATVRALMYNANGDGCASCTHEKVAVQHSRI